MLQLGVVAGVIGAIVLGSDIYQDLVNATKARNGVFMLVKQNGETKSYKITNRSCINHDFPNGTTPYAV